MRGDGRENPAPPQPGGMPRVSPSEAMTVRVLAFFAFLVLSAPAVAQAQVDVRIQRVSDGTPDLSVQVEVRNPGAVADVEILFQSLRSGFVEEYETLGLLSIPRMPAGARQQYDVVLTKKPRDGFDTSALVRVNGTSQGRRPLGAAGFSESILRVGELMTGAPAAVEAVRLESERLRNSNKVGFEAEPLPVSRFPSSWNVLADFQVIVARSAQIALLSSEQASALRDWIIAGGRLFIHASEKSNAALAGPLATATPLEWGSWSPIGALSDSDPRWLPSGAARAAQARLRAGSELVHGLPRRPLVARSRLGAGLIYGVAWDYGDAAQKRASGRLWRTESGIVWPGPDGAAADSSSTASLASGIENLSILDPPSFYVIAGFLLLYVLILVPVNYGVLNKMKRRELAWITIPLLVLAFSAGAYGIGYSRRGGRDVLATSALIITSPGLSSGLQAAESGFFSPTARTTRLLVEPQPDSPTIFRLSSWKAEFSATPGTQDASRQLFGDEEGAERVSMPMWSMTRAHSRTIRRLGSGIEVRRTGPGKLHVRNGTPFRISRLIWVEDGNLWAEQDAIGSGKAAELDHAALRRAESAEERLSAPLPGWSAEQIRIAKKSAGFLDWLPVASCLVGYIEAPVETVYVPGSRPVRHELCYIAVYLDGVGETRQ